MFWEVVPEEVHVLCIPHVAGVHLSGVHGGILPLGSTRVSHLRDTRSVPSVTGRE